MRQFYGRLEKCVLSAGKTHVHKIPRFRGGVFWVWGGGSADFIFMGARIFLKMSETEAPVLGAGLAKVSILHICAIRFARVIRAHVSKMRLARVGC